MSTVARAFALSTIGLTLCSCATESISVRVLRPAPVNLGQYDLIAVESFTGTGGDQIANELTTALTNTRNPMTGRADFEILDRRDIDQMLDDLRRGRGNDWNEEAMEVLERWKNAEILLKGTVHVYDVGEQVSETQWLDPNGYLHVTYTRECEANIRVLIEATDTEGDTIFDTVEFHEVAVDSTQGVDEYPPSINHEAVLATARNSVVQQYLLRVVPREEYVQVHLYTDGDYPALQMGNGFAKTGSWDEALDSYRTAVDQMKRMGAETRYMALFNMGIAYEYTNQFDEARRALKEAYALEQDDMILQEIQRVSYREREYAQLVQQGAAAIPPR